MASPVESQAYPGLIIHARLRLVSGIPGIGTLPFRVKMHTESAHHIRHHLVLENVGENLRVEASRLVTL